MSEPENNNDSILGGKVEEEDKIYITLKDYESLQHDIESLRSKLQEANREMDHLMNDNRMVKVYI